ncbi:hypothetical protein GCM10011609_17130 [Lentzea pudingi]|uniref:Uncharacterized protein n=1 Tax=Lentzea pudingi TaxID=1789439 RepID=A0ABQ2HIW6_9PSEU|nr:hypothetical protein [Lentzea pudingi]GGM81682.1 hypothetical protein GCM10011609_17130 [Lentzea pudingi]
MQGRPSTVWPCAQDDFGEGTGLLAGWLLTAVVKAVTTYTRPGQRVLLLEPAEPCRSGAYAGLREAAWTVVRLGRGVQTQTVVARSEEDERLSAESGHGLGASVDSPTSDGLAGLPTPAESGVDGSRRGLGPDRYDLVVAAADPRTLSWFRPTDWSCVLSPSGVLAVLTHGDRASHRLADPASSLVRAADSAGLLYRDRIALLRSPVRDGALVVMPPFGNVSARTSTRPPTTPIRHVRVHEDLFVFARQSVADGEVSADA